MWAKHTKNHTYNSKSGFTIVELLIVIVVIAILATITIVAYNGISSRAKASAAQTMASQAARKIIAYSVQKDGDYPVSLEEAGITNTTGLEYSYDNNSTPKKFGVTASSGNTSYYVSNDVTNPTLGGYAGHSQNGVAAITNLATNPNFETNSTGSGAVNGASTSRVAGAAITGATGLRISCPAGGTTDCGVNLGFGVAVDSGKTYTYKVTIRAIVAGTYSTYTTSSSGGGSTQRASVVLAANEVGNLVITSTATGTGNATWYILRTNNAVNSQFDLDSVMVTEGTNAYAFADGTTANWRWNGTAHASTSTGPGAAL